MAREKVSCLKRAGFSGNDLGIYAMAGLPDQSPRQVLDEIDFIRSLGVMPKPVWLSPVPGTRLFRHYAKMFPEITADPLWHNDLFFYHPAPGMGRGGGRGNTGEGAPGLSSLLFSIFLA
ncbi:MAG: hypothetical protein JXA71_08875 [Chitinispirillaceae bacterium]|nr:hypothetical protein [Chitinispirillaceae bacterium]